MYVFEICAEGIFVTFPWWLGNVKSRSKIDLFSNERHFEIWFPKKRTITFFLSKLSKLHKKRPNFASGNYIFPKTRGNKNKPWTHSTPLNCSLRNKSSAKQEHLDLLSLFSWQNLTQRKLAEIYCWYETCFSL